MVDWFSFGNVNISLDLFKLFVLPVKLNNDRRWVVQAEIAVQRIDLYSVVMEIMTSIQCVLSTKMPI